MTRLRKQASNSVISSAGRSLWMLLLVVLLVGGLLMAAYYLGLISGHRQIQQDREQIDLLNQTNNELQQELNQAQEQSIFSQRQLQIQEQAYKQLNLSYAGEEQKNSYLESRLNFYRSIISPESGEAGPAIHSLNYEQAGSAIKFDVTMVQAIKNDQQVMGKLHLELYQAEQLVAKWPAGDARAINFQYFVQVSGEFEDVSLSNDTKSSDTKIKVELELSEGNLIERWFPSAPEQINDEVELE